MLKTFLILILFISFSAVAQQYKLDSVVQTINGAQFITTQKYDTRNKKAELVRYERAEANSAIQKLEHTQVTYDDKGNEISQIFSPWNPTKNTWDEEEKTEKEFNTDNKLIRVSTHHYKNNRWMIESENTRVYTPNSIIETDYETKDNKLQPMHKNISVTNAFDKIKTHETFLWNDKSQSWQPLTQTKNNYQNDTILIGYETLKWKENQWQKQEKVVYELNAKGNITNNYTLYNARHNSWVPINKFEEEDFPQQNKKISNTYRWLETDNKWIIHSQTETFFNEHGKKQDVLISERDTSTHQLKLQLEQMFFYDDALRLNLFQYFDHSAKKITGIQNSIKLDKEGNVIQENQFELDAENNIWIEKTTTESEYYQNIVLDTAVEAHKKLDFFGLNVYNYINNKHATKNVKTYQYRGGKKVLHEEFQFFYSIVK